MEGADLEYVAIFKQQLDRFAGICTFCMIQGCHEAHHDILQQCHMLRYGPGVSQYKKFRGGLAYRSDRGLTGICFFCHVPNGNQDSLHPAFGNRNDCDYPDLIAPLVFGLFMDRDIRKEMETYFKNSFDSMDEFVQWLNSYPVPGHKSNLTAVFLWYATIFTRV